jgi:hypothetical protein
LAINFTPLPIGTTTITWTGSGKIGPRNTLPGFSCSIVITHCPRVLMGWAKTLYPALLGIARKNGARAMAPLDLPVLVVCQSLACRLWCDRYLGATQAICP